MRTNTGTIEEVLPNGMVRIQTNSNSLYSPCSASLCADNVVLDAVNKIGAKKGEYVEFTIPDEHMVSGALLCFGLPLLIILLCAVAGAYIGPQAFGTSTQNGAIIGFCIGIPIAIAAIKTYDLVMKSHNNRSEVIALVDEE